MLPLDATELYDLSEAGRLLWTDAKRLERWIRTRRIPGVRTEAGWRLPRAWVDAAAGIVATDEEGLRRYWLERLAPASREARRPSRDAGHLADPVLDADDAGRRVGADPRRLARLDAEGTLPALRIDGATRYDEALVEAARDEGLEGEATATRRRLVREASRFEYVTDLDAGAALPPTDTRPAPAAATVVAPHAWRMPDDLGEALPPPAQPGEEGESEADGTEATDADDGSRLIRADGYETVDEDD